MGLVPLITVEPAAVHLAENSTDMWLGGVNSGRSELRPPTRESSITPTGRCHNTYLCLEETREEGEDLRRDRSGYWLQDQDMEMKCRTEDRPIMIRNPDLCKPLKDRLEGLSLYEGPSTPVFCVSQNRARDTWHHHR